VSDRAKPEVPAVTDVEDPRTPFEAFAVDFLAARDLGRAGLLPGRGGARLRAGRAHDWFSSSLSCAPRNSQLWLSRCCW